MMEMPHKEQLKQFLNKGGLPLIFIRRFKMLRLIKNILGKTIKFIYRMTYKLIPTHKKQSCLLPSMVGGIAIILELFMSI